MIEDRPQPQERMYQPLRKLLFSNFLAGIAWGLGSAVGGAIIVAMIGFFVARNLELPTLERIVELTVQELQTSEP